MRIDQIFLPQEKSDIITRNRIPRNFFITTGIGESNITIHAGSYHLALREAGIELCNIITYSSILPGIATEIERPDDLVHGSVMETIMAVASAEKGQRATAGLIFGWLYNKDTGERHGGLVCEYNGNKTEAEAEESLKQSLNELYVNGYSEDFDMRGERLMTKTIVPQKKFGTALIALCFTDYVHPVV